MAAERAPGAAPVGRRIRLRPRIKPRIRVVAPKPKREPARPVQHAAATVGAVFGLIGLLGFLPGLTSHIDDLTVAGHHTTTLLFGLFAVSVLHNVIHLLYAVAGLASATSVRTARWYLLAGGAGYLLIALAGLTPAAQLVPLNPPDNWLHAILGAVTFGLGFLPGRTRGS